MCVRINEARVDPAARGVEDLSVRKLRLVDATGNNVRDLVALDDHVAEKDSLWRDQLAVPQDLACLCDHTTIPLQRRAQLAGGVVLLARSGPYVLPGFHGLAHSHQLAGNPLEVRRGVNVI